jgi:acyl carrier protein
MRDDYLNEVRDFIVENFLFGDAGNLANGTSFMESRIVDSTGILELVFHLEETYGIKVEDDELIPENLDNLENVARFLERKLGGVSDRQEGATE